MKKSILTLAVLAAVCPAAFAADADTIKTIVWTTTTDPVLTNLTFDYTGAQLKAGSNGKSYFDVVDVIGATGRKDDVGLVVNANGSVNSSGDTQVIVLGISGDADVNFGGSTLDVALDTDLVGTGNNMAAALLVWNAKTEVSADVSNFTVKSTNAQGKSVYGLVVNNKSAQLHLTGRTVNVVVESATERTTDKQYSEALGLDIAAGTLSSSEGTTLNIKGRSTSKLATKISEAEKSGVNYTGATPLTGIKFEGGQGNFAGDVSIDVASDAGLVHGIWITNYFYNTTNGGVFGSSSGNFNNLRIASSSNSGDAYGICGSYTPKEDQSYDVILKVAGDLDVSAQSETGNAYGIHLSGKSDVLFTGNVNILASAAEGKEAQAIYAEGSALNFTGERIALTGDVLVNNGGKVVIGRTAEASALLLAEDEGITSADVSPSVVTINGDVSVSGTGELVLQNNKEVTFNGDVSINSETGTGLTLDNTNAKLTGESTLTADKVSSNNSTLYVSDVATADVVNLATSGNTTVIVDDTKNTVNFGSVTKSEQSDTITTVGSSRFNEQYASAEDAAKAVLDVVTTGTGENKTTAADKVVVEESESNGSFTADLKQDENGNTVFDQSTVTHTLNTKTERIGKTVAQNIHAWRLEMNDMNKRLGELRDCEGNAGVWARVNAGKQKIDGSKNDFTQLQFGADAKIEALANIHAGVAFSYTNSDLSYAGGEGDNNVFGLAAYGSWLGDNGSFIDVIARVARLESDSMIDGTAADFNTTAYSISAEIGHRFDLAPTVFIEPQAEMSWGYVDGKTFSTVNKVTGIAVDTTVDSTTSLIGRLGVRAGITCPNKKGTAYVRTSVLHEFDGDVSVTRGDGTYREDAGDTWFEYAIGGSYNLTGTTQFYADLSRTSNAEIAEPWRFNVGARWAF